MAGTLVSIIRQQPFNFSGGQNTVQLMPIGPPVLTTAWTSGVLLVSVVDSGSPWNQDSRLSVVAFTAMHASDAPGWLYPPSIDEPIGVVRIDGSTPMQNVLYAARLGDLRPFGKYMQVFLVWEQGANTGSANPTLRVDVVGRDGKFGLMPYMLPGRQLHLRSDVGARRVTGTMNVNQWYDQSGNGRHAANAGQTTQMPTFVENAFAGLPSLSFDGGDILSTPAFSLSTFTIFTAFNEITATTAGIVYEQSADANANDGCYLYGSNTSTVFVKRGVPSSGKNYTANWATDSTFRIIRHEYQGTHASHLFYVNGTVPTLTNGNANDPGTAASTAQSMFVGARSGPTFGITGNMMELLVYSPALSQQDAQRLERDYFSPRYRITVA